MFRQPVMSLPVPQILAIECAVPVFSQGPEPDVSFGFVVNVIGGGTMYRRDGVKM